MSTVVKWRVPADVSESTYDYVYIYRATSEAGIYSNIANQLISDTTYYDYEGTSSNWYKIRFYDTTNTSWSNYSEAIQGGTFVGLCTPDDIRVVANITSSELTDSQLWDIIQFAQKLFCKEINSKIIEEDVESIDADERQNKIDGSNTEYYVQNSYTWFIGDDNADGEVDENDVKVWQYDSTNDTKTALTVTAVDPELGKITLQSAPSTGMMLTITYPYSPVNMDTPDPIVIAAATFLAASLAFTKIQAKDFNRMSLGKLSLARTISSSKVYDDKYKEMLNLIKSRMLRRVSDKNKLVYP